MRLDFQLYDESGFWWIAPKHLDGNSLSEFIAKLFDSEIHDLLEHHAVLPITMYGDGGNMKIRVVLGDLTAEEQDNWTARTTATLDLATGQLWIGTSCDPDVYADHPDPVSLEALANDKQPRHTLIDFGYLDVPPDLYRVDLYCFPPCDMSATWESIVEPGSWAGTHPEAEPLAAYFQRTRTDAEMPDWIGHALYSQQVITDDRFSQLPGDRWLEFLVHLTPIAEPLPPPQLDEGGYNLWETRKPPRCPVGVLADL